MKKCFKCDTEKPLSDFYVHKKMGDGFLNKCKSCTKSEAKERQTVLRKELEYIEKERKRGREKYRRLYSDVKKYNPSSIKKFFERYPEKKNAIYACQYLKKPFEGAQKHHWSYNEEHYVDIIWLSRKDHMKGHRFIVYDQERMMYRRYDTNELLDTKERHELFIKSCIAHKED